MSVIYRVSSVPVPAANYTAEDGSTIYTAEDGVTAYTTE
jgi:hypothetical protein